MGPNRPSVVSGNVARRALGRRSAVIVLAVIAVLAGDCSSTSPTREIDNDSSRDPIAGPPPTAPPVTEYAGPGLSTEAVALLQQLRDFQQETDLCSILSSKTVKTVLGGDLDASGLVTTPSGIAQMLVALEDFFRHLVDISPPAVRPSMETLRQTWKDLSAIEADALDREAQTEAILSSPQVESAVANMGTWMKQNCLGQPSSPFDLSSLFGLTAR